MAVEVHRRSVCEGLFRAGCALRGQSRRGPQACECGPQGRIGIPALHHEHAVDVSGTVGGTGQSEASSDADDDHVIGHAIVGLGGRLQMAVVGGRVNMQQRGFT